MDSLTHVRFKGAQVLFRRKVPRNLVAKVGRTEIVRSLPRGSLITARRQSRALWIATEKVFEMLRSDTAITPQQIEQLLSAVRAECDWADEIRLARSGALFDHAGDAPPEADALVMEVHADDYRDALDRNDINPVREQTHEYAKRLNIRIEPDSLDEQLIGRAILRAYVESCTTAANNSRSRVAAFATNEANSLPYGNAVETLDADEEVECLFGPIPATASVLQIAPDPTNARLSMLTATERPAHALKPTMSISQVWDLFADDMEKFGPLSDDDDDDDAANISRRPRRWKSSRQAKSTLRLWIRVYGEKPIAVWTRKQAVDLRRLFVQLPQKYGQGKEWKGKTPMTIATEYQAQIKAETNPERQYELLSKANKFKTWNRHLSIFNALLPWAASNGLVAHGAPSPFRKLFVWVDDDLDPSEGGSEKRKMWLERQLAKLFASPLFTGFRSPSRLWMAGEMMVQDALYWVILIIAHSGMRREEPCQLLVKHVVQDEETGIWYFDLKAQGLVLKEPASKRWVVLHNNLLQLGFIEKQVLGRDPNEQLFPELYRSSADDKFGDKLGQSFLEYRRAYDTYCLELDNTENPFVPLYEHLRDLHSFRTTVCTTLIRLGVPQAHAEEFTGHKSPARKTAFVNYDKGATLTILKEAINKLVLPVDVSRLIEAAKKHAVRET